MKKDKRIFTVLCIDGGGVRGLIPARILQEIEERTGKPICELFDMVGGPSTGAILATGLSVPDPQDRTKPKYSAEEMKNFYYKHAPKIFPEMRFKSLRQLSNGTLYDPKPLEEALEKSFGDMKIKDSLTHLIIPVTDIKHFKPAWIKNIKNKKDESPEGWSTMLMRDAVRAATTVPTYFPAKYHNTTPNEDMPNVTHRHALIDGGFFAGNTLHRLLREAKLAAPEDAEIVFIHIGTGAIDNSLSPEEFNKLGPLGMISKSKGSIMMSLAVNLGVEDAAEELKEELGQNFVGLDGKMPLEEGPIPIDNASEKNLKRLEAFAERIIADKATELDRLCDILRHRDITEAAFHAGRTAFDQLVIAIESQSTVRSVNRIYKKIQGQDTSDPDINTLAAALTEHHRQQLDKIYRNHHHKLADEQGLKGIFKDAKEDIEKLLKKAREKQNNDIPPANDNKDGQDNSGENKSPPPAKKRRPGFGF